MAELCIKARCGYCGEEQYHAIRPEDFRKAMDEGLALRMVCESCRKYIILPIREIDG